MAVGTVVVPPLLSAMTAWLFLVRSSPRFGSVLLVTLPCHLVVVGVGRLVALSR